MILSRAGVGRGGNTVMRAKGSQAGGATPRDLCDMEGHSSYLRQGTDARRDREDSPQPLAVLSPAVS